MAFKFSKRSIDNLSGVHPELVLVVSRALLYSKNDFAVIEGLRTKERQAELVADGFSWTMNSHHLTGDAVDLAPIVNGRVSWANEDFYPLADAMKQAAEELSIDIQWGGDWGSNRFDGAHFQRDRNHDQPRTSKSASRSI